MNLDTIFLACSFKVLTQALMVWNNYVRLIDLWLFWPGGIGTSVFIFVCKFFCVLYLYSVQGPGWIFAFLQSRGEVLFLSF